MAISTSECGIPFGYLEDALKNFDDYGIEAALIEGLRDEWRNIRMMIAS